MTQSQLEKFKVSNFLAASLENATRVWGEGESCSNAELSGGSEAGGMQGGETSRPALHASPHVRRSLLYAQACQEAKESVV